MEKEKEESLLSNLTSEEILEKVKSDKKWKNKLRSSPTFAVNILHKTSKNPSKHYIDQIINIIFDYQLNLTQMNSLYSFAMSGSRTNLLEKLKQNKLNIYDKVNNSYVLFGFIVRNRFDIINDLFNYQLKTDKHIRWNIKSTSNDSLSSCIYESIFYRSEQIEILKKMEKDSLKNQINEAGASEKSFKASIEKTLLKKNYHYLTTNSLSDFLKDMDTYFLLLPVVNIKNNEFTFLSKEAKNKIIKDILVDYFVKKNFLLSESELVEFIRYINSKPFDIYKEKVIYDCVKGNIDLKQFKNISQIVDVTDEMIKEIPNLKRNDLVEHLTKLKQIKDEKSLLMGIVQDNSIEQINKKRL